MERRHLIFATLDALLELTAVSRPETGALCRLVGASPTRVAEALLHLERRGLVDASRVRLTMSGLAAASALRECAPALARPRPRPRPRPRQSPSFAGMRTMRSVAG